MLLFSTLAFLSANAQEIKPYSFGTLTSTRGISPSRLRRLPVAGDISSSLHEANINLINHSGDTALVSSGPFFEIPIQQGTTPSGGLTYSIPVLPAASAKGAPPISIAYNSQAGRGLAGFGWDISGLSAISITNKNLYYNGIVSPADVSDVSSFYTLDGDAIVPNADSLLFPGYGYETARGHAKIRKHVNGGVVTHFDVLYPDGSRAIFGDSLATQARSSFPITSLTDKEGFATIFNYIRSAEENCYYLSSVEYGSKNIGDEPCSISFSWEDRQDVLIQYCAGEGITVSKILKSVSSFDGDSLVLSYSLVHEYEDGHSFLKRLDCTRGGEQANPLLFKYGEEYPASPEPQTHYLWSSRTINVADGFDVGDDNFLFIRGKYVSNTFSDGVAIIPARPYFTLRQSLGNAKYYGSGYLADESIVIIPSVSDESDAVEIKAGKHVVSIAAVDVDGDSVDEIVRIREVDESSTSTTKHYSVRKYKYSVDDGTFSDSYFNPTLNGVFETGSVFKIRSANQRVFFYGDFRGDGGMQAVGLSYSTNSAGYNQTPYAAVIDLVSLSKLSDEVLFDTYTEADSCNVFALDIDSDGRTELCRTTSYGLELYHLSSAGTFILDRTVPGVSPTTVTRAGRLTCHTDLNGDGYLDIAVSPPVGSGLWDVYSFTGTEFIHSYMTSFAANAGERYVFIDVNADGLPDCHVLDGNFIRSYINTNGSISYLWSNLLNVSSSTETVPVNVLSYNAASSFFSVEGSHIITYSPSEPGQMKRALTRMVDSHGRVNLNSYAMMDDSEVYHVDTGQTCNNAAGFADIAAPLLLLRSTDSYASGSKQLLQSRYYDYSNAVAHQFGLGFCGFRQIRCTDYLSPGNHTLGVTGDRPLVTIQTFDPQKMGVPLCSRVRLGWNGHDISRTDYSWDNRSTAHGKLNPRLVSTTQTDSLAGLTTVTSYTYDSRDFPVLTQTVRTNELGDSKKDSVRVTYSHQYSSGRYILGGVLEQSNIRIARAGDVTDTWMKKETHELDSLSRVTARRDYAWYHEKRRPNPDFLPPDPILDPLLAGTGSSVQGLPGGQGDGGSGADSPDAVDMGDLISLYLTESEGGGLVSDEEYHYDAFGNVDTLRSYHHGSTLPLVTTYVHDDQGRHLLSSTDPMGLTTSYSGYTVFGQPSVVTDARGRATSITFDNWGNAVRTDYADGSWESSTTVWDTSSQGSTVPPSGASLYRVNTLNSAGQQGVTHYDAAGRVVRSGSLRFDGRWLVSDRQYDAATGLLSRESLPHPADAPDSAYLWNSIEYDTFGRDTATVQASGRRSTANYNRSVVSTTADGITTTRTVNADGHVVLVHDNDGDIVNYVRPDGQLDSVKVHGGVRTVFAYDAYGARYRIDDPSLGTQTDTTVWHADGSSVTTTTSSYGTVTATTDRFGRVTQVRTGTHPRFAETVTRSYDSYGMLTSAVSSDGPALAYTYDAFDRPLTVTQTGHDGHSFTKGYTYNADGTTAGVSYSSSFAGGLLATELYTYSNGVLCQTALADGTLISRIDAENDLGQTVLASTPHGVQRTYGYTPAGLPASRSIGAATEVYSWQAQTGDLASRSFRPSGSAASPSQWTIGQFFYDSSRRLLAEDTSGPGDAFTHRSNSYDAYGNATSIGGAATMQYATSGKPYTLSSYTAADTQNQRNVRDGYDEAGRPSILYYPEKQTNVSIYYGADGYRSRMVVTRLFSTPGTLPAAGSVSTQALPAESGTDALFPILYGESILTRHYFGGGRLEADVTSGGGTTLRLYLGGGPYDAPAVLVRDSLNNTTVYNIWRDYLGSVRAVGTDSTDIAYCSYDTWGRPCNPQTLQPLPYDAQANILQRGFTGHEYLPWFGLYNANARLYDPLLGRFLSPDPYIQDPFRSQNYNRYAYCLNNPYRYTDQSGECFITSMLIAAAVGAVIVGTGNTVAHAIRGDRGLLRYFFQGALAGAVIGASIYSAGYGLGLLSTSLISQGGTAAIWGNALSTAMNIGQTISSVYSGVRGLAEISSLAGGLIQHGWKGLANFGKIYLSRFYLDENDFWGGVRQGVSRFTWERVQTEVGYTYTQFRHAFGSSIDRVDYLGGVTFATNENSKYRQGVTIGNYCNIDIWDTIGDDFESHAVSDPLFMHEFGHTIDSRAKGPWYLFSVGTRSLWSSAHSTPVNEYTTSHDYKSYERRANRNAASYFSKYYGVDWKNDQFTNHYGEGRSLTGANIQWFPL